MHTILVTGALGFIGRRLLVALHERGYRTIGLDRVDPGQKVKEDCLYVYRWITADISKELEISLPSGIDGIIHLAGKAHALAEVKQDDTDYFRINTDGTKRILNAAQKAGVKAFILFSTVKAAGGEKIERVGTISDNTVKASDLGVNPSRFLVPISESCELLPDTAYGRSKRAAEQLVLDGCYVPHPVVIRPCLVYGPTPKGNLEKMIAAVKRGVFPPLPETNNRRSMVHIDDVIEAALLAFENPKAAGQIYIAADNEPFSTRQLYDWMRAAIGRGPANWSIPLWGLRGMGLVGDVIGKARGRRFVFDSDALEKLVGNAWYSSAKMQRELGWTPKHTLRETIPLMMSKD